MSSMCLLSVCVGRFSLCFTCVHIVNKPGVYTVDLMTDIISFKLLQCPSVHVSVLRIMPSTSPIGD